MTEYGISHSRQLTEPSYNVQERKAARKRLLEALRQRRRENYKHLMQKKRQLHTDSDLATIA
jgi:hypothetical protein